MQIIKKSKLKKLKECRKACERIYAAMVAVNEDEHGNVIPYNDDKLHKTILDALADAGYGKVNKRVVGVAEWKYDFPWELDGR